MSALARQTGNHSFHILLVDDELAVCDSVKQLLQFDGHEVSVAESGEAALAQLNQRKFDLVITDYFMPGMRGDELVTRIRQLFPNQRIIVASAFVDESKFARSTNHVDAFLLKPFSMKELRDAVDRAVCHVGVSMLRTTEHGMEVNTGRPDQLD